MFSGDQSFSRDRQLDLMGDEWGRIRYPFWGFLVPTGFESGFALKTVRFILVFPVYSSFSGFYGFFSFFMVFSVFGVNRMETWDLWPLVSISHSGLLVRMRGVLQGVSGGALQVVR